LRRAKAASKYRPDKIRLLLVVEAPPSDPSRYFYFEDVAHRDSLFRYVARTLLNQEPTRSNKKQLLQDLKETGSYLIDLKLDPVDSSSLRDHVRDLVRRSKELRPEKVILIKATVYDATFRALRQAGLPVVDERIPFPGSGQQRRFVETFERALKKGPDQT
jgi:hypothetical protein